MNHSSDMSDSEVLAATAGAARDERRTTVDLLALLAEVDARRLHLGEGCSSLFAYCTQVLHLSEHAAYHRIEAARAARQYPVILELLAKGDVTLTTVAMLRPHLTAENHAALLEAARHKSKRDVEYQIACLAPKEDARTVVRRLPERPAMAGPALAPATASPTVAGVGSSASVLVPPSEPRRRGTPIAAAHPRPTIEPLAAERYLLRVYPQRESARDAQACAESTASPDPGRRPGSTSRAGTGPAGRAIGKDEDGEDVETPPAVKNSPRFGRRAAVSATDSAFIRASSLGLGGSCFTTPCESRRCCSSLA